MTKYIGLLTSGGDCPGLNAAIRGIGKAAQSLGLQVIGFRDGFRGLMENRTVQLDGPMLSGILTVGGTILGTSREKPYRMLIGGKELDVTDGVFGVMVAARGEGAGPVPLEKVAGKRKLVPLDHPWIESARLVGTALGD